MRRGRVQRAVDDGKREGGGRSERLSDKMIGKGQFPFIDLATDLTPAGHPAAVVSVVDHSGLHATAATVLPLSRAEASITD